MLDRVQTGGMPKKSCICRSSRDRPAEGRGTAFRIAMAFGSDVEYARGAQNFDFLSTNRTTQSTPSIVHKSEPEWKFIGYKTDEYVRITATIPKTLVLPSSIHTMNEHTCYYLIRDAEEVNEFVDAVKTVSVKEIEELRPVFHSLFQGVDA